MAQLNRLLRKLSILLIGLKHLFQPIGCILLLILCCQKKNTGATTFIRGVRLCTRPRLSHVMIGFVWRVVIVVDFEGCVEILGNCCEGVLLLIVVVVILFILGGGHLRDLTAYAYDYWVKLSRWALLFGLLAKKNFWMLLDAWNWVLICLCKCVQLSFKNVSL